VKHCRVLLSRRAADFANILGVNRLILLNKPRFGVHSHLSFPSENRRGKWFSGKKMNFFSFRTLFVLCSFTPDSLSAKQTEGRVVFI